MAAPTTEAETDKDAIVVAAVDESAADTTNNDDDADDVPHYNLPKPTEQLIVQYIETARSKFFNTEYKDCVEAVNNATCFIQEELTLIDEYHAKKQKQALAITTTSTTTELPSSTAAAPTVEDVDEEEYIGFMSNKLKDWLQQVHIVYIYYLLELAQYDKAQELLLSTSTTRTASGASSTQLTFSVIEMEFLKGDFYRMTGQYLLALNTYGSALGLLSDYRRDYLGVASHIETVMKHEWLRKMIFLHLASTYLILNDFTRMVQIIEDHQLMYSFYEYLHILVTHPGYRDSMVLNPMSATTKGLSLSLGMTTSAAAPRPDSSSNNGHVTYENVRRSEIFSKLYIHIQTSEIIYISNKLILLQAQYFKHQCAYKDSIILLQSILNNTQISSEKFQQTPAVELNLSDEEKSKQIVSENGNNNTNKPPQQLLDNSGKALSLLNKSSLKTELQVYFELIDITIIINDYQTSFSYLEHSYQLLSVMFPNLYSSDMLAAVLTLPYDKNNSRITNAILYNFKTYPVMHTSVSRSPSTMKQDGQTVPTSFDYFYINHSEAAATSDVLKLMSHPLLAQLFGYNGRICLQVERYERAHVIFQQGITMEKLLLAPLTNNNTTTTKLHCTDRLGLLQFYTGECKRCTGQHDDALHCYQTALMTFIQCYASYQDSLYNTNTGGKGGSSSSRSLDSDPSMLDKLVHLQVYDVQRSIGLTYLATHDYLSAYALLRQISHDQYNFIYHQHNMKNIELASTSARNVYRFKLCLSYEVTKLWLACVYALLYRLETAHVLIAKTSKHIMEIFGDQAENVVLANCFYIFGEIMSAKGRFVDASNLYTHSIAILKKNLKKCKIASKYKNTKYNANTAIENSMQSSSVLDESVQSSVTMNLGENPLSVVDKQGLFSATPSTTATNNTTLAAGDTDEVSGFNEGSYLEGGDSSILEGSVLDENMTALSLQNNNAMETQSSATAANPNSNSTAAAAALGTNNLNEITSLVGDVTLASLTAAEVAAAVQGAESEFKLITRNNMNSNNNNNNLTTGNANTNNSTSMLNFKKMAGLYSTHIPFVLLALSQSSYQPGDYTLANDCSATAYKMITTVYQNAKNHQFSFPIILQRANIVRDIHDYDKAEIFYFSLLRKMGLDVTGLFQDMIASVSAAASIATTSKVLEGNADDDVSLTGSDNTRKLLNFEGSLFDVLALGGSLEGVDASQSIESLTSMHFTDNQSPTAADLPRTHSVGPNVASVSNMSSRSNGSYQSSLNTNTRPSGRGGQTSQQEQYLNFSSHIPDKLLLSDVLINYGECLRMNHKSDKAKVVILMSLILRKTLFLSEPSTMLMDMTDNLSQATRNTQNSLPVSNHVTFDATTRLMQMVGSQQMFTSATSFNEPQPPASASTAVGDNNSNNNMATAGVTDEGAVVSARSAAYRNELYLLQSRPTTQEQGVNIDLNNRVSVAAVDGADHAAAYLRPTSATIKNAMKPISPGIYYVYEAILSLTILDMDSNSFELIQRSLYTLQSFLLPQFHLLLPETHPLLRYVEGNIGLCMNAMTMILYENNRYVQICLYVYYRWLSFTLTFIVINVPNYIILIYIYIYIFIYIFIYIDCPSSSH